MGKELQMARSKRGRPSVLLVGSRPRLPVYSSARRNKGKKAASTIKEGKRGKVKDSSAASKIGTEVEGPYGDSLEGAEFRGYEQDDKDRKSNRGIEGERQVSRRSASELGIEWIGSYCPDKQPHFLISYSVENIGSLFKCRNCLKQIWLPSSIGQSVILETLIGRFGPEKGYRLYLDENPEARMLVAKLQDLWYARRKITNDEQFAKLVISVMDNKEYDRIGS